LPQTDNGYIWPSFDEGDVNDERTRRRQQLDDEDGFVISEPVFISDEPVVISDEAIVISDDDHDDGDMVNEVEESEEEDDGFSSLDEDMAIAMAAEVERQVRTKQRKLV